MLSKQNISLQATDSANQLISPQQDAQDSIQIVDSTNVVSGQSTTERFFTSKREENITYNPQPIPRVNNEWQALALSFSILMIAFVRISGRHFFRNLQLGMISRPIYRQLMRDGELLPQSGTFMLLVSFLLVVTVLLFQINEHFLYFAFPEGSGNLFNALLILGSLASLILSRYLIMRSLGFIFKIAKPTKEYITNNIFFNTITTIILIPMLLFSIYSRSDIILYSSVGIALALFILKFVRGLFIAFEVRYYSGYQIILYLCALEILPVFILLKILTSYISMI